MRKACGKNAQAMHAGFGEAAAGSGLPGSENRLDGRADSLNGRHPCVELSLSAHWSSD